MPTRIDPNQELCELLDDPTCPFWVQNLVPIILSKDPVDAANTIAHLAEILDRRVKALLPPGPRYEPWTAEEEKEHHRIHGVATMADSVREYASNAGEEMPERPWILSPFDTWEANPHYRGPQVPHPESQEWE